MTSAMFVFSLGFMTYLTICSIQQHKPSSCRHFKFVVFSRSLRLRRRKEWSELFLWICWRKCSTLTPWDALSQATFCFISFWLALAPTTNGTVNKRSENIKGVWKALHLGEVLQDKRKCLTPLPIAPVPSPIYHLLTMAYFFMMEPKVPKFGGSEAGIHPGQFHTYTKTLLALNQPCCTAATHYMKVW